MKHLILLMTLFIGSITFSQGMGDVTIYSNTGNKFYVVLNGIRQNNAPETNVKVTGLTNQWYECKIMSANNNFTIDKKIMVKYDTLITYRIVEKKGKYKMRFFSETPLGTATAQPDQTVVTYHSTETPTDNSNTENVNVSSNVNVNEGTNATTTTTTSNTTSTSENLNTNSNVNAGNGTETVNINMSISENGQGADVNMSVSGTGMEENVETTTSSDVNSTNSSTTTSSSTNGSTYYEESTTTTTTTSTGDGNTYHQQTTTTTTTTSSGNGVNATTANEGNIYQDDDMTVTMESNCNATDDEVKGIVDQIKNESFSDDQSRIGNMAAENKCMNTDQIMHVANAFTFEDSKLEFLKKAYDNCPDKSNYYKVMETLTYSTDKEELQKYINTH